MRNLCQYYIFECKDSKLTLNLQIFYADFKSDFKFANILCRFKQIAEHQQKHV